jgi:hypothetical protein
MRGSMIMQGFFYWLVGKYGVDALLYYDINVNCIWLFDELYEDGIITDADLEGVDPKSVYALIFDHQEQLAVGVFPADFFLMFLRACGFGGEVIGNKVFQLPPNKNSYCFKKEAYLLIREDFRKKIRAPAE